MQAEPRPKVVSISEVPELGAYYCQQQGTRTSSKLFGGVGTQLRGDETGTRLSSYSLPKRAGKGISSPPQGAMRPKHIK